MTYVWIRRGYGAFVRCKNEAKARRRAKHWHNTGQGDAGVKHTVIGLFITKNSNVLSQSTREGLYGS